MTTKTNFNDTLAETNIPKLSNVSYQDAHDAFANKITFETLRKRGYETEDASALANSVKGSARERLAKIARTER